MSRSTTEMNRAYAALLTEATRIGWPTAYKSDLDHDRRAIERMLPREPFAWAIGAHGTHIGRSNPSAGQLTMLMVSHAFPESRWYVWDGVMLREYPTAHDADRRLSVLVGARYQSELRLGEPFVTVDTWEAR